MVIKKDVIRSFVLNIQCINQIAIFINIRLSKKSSAFLVSIIETFEIIFSLMLKTSLTRRLLLSLGLKYVSMKGGSKQDMNLSK